MRTRIFAEPNKVKATGYREQLSVILSTSAIEITVDVPPNRFTIAQISKFNVAYMSIIFSLHRLLKRAHSTRPPPHASHETSVADLASPHTSSGSMFGTSTDLDVLRGTLSLWLQHWPAGRRARHPMNDARLCYLPCVHAMLISPAAAARRSASTA